MNGQFHTTDCLPLANEPLGTHKLGQHAGLISSLGAWRREKSLVLQGNEPEFLNYSVRSSVTIPPTLYWLSWTALARLQILWSLIMKPTTCTNFSNLFLDWNSTCFGHFLCPSSGVFHCTHSKGICQTGLLTACEQDQDGTSLSGSQAVSKPVWHTPLLCVQWKTPDDRQRNCLKHVEFQSKKKFEKLVHLVGFIIRNLSRCMVTWTSNSLVLYQHIRSVLYYRIL